MDAPPIVTFHELFKKICIWGEPLIQPWRRLIEAVATLKFVFTFVFMGHCGLVLSLYMLFTRWYWICLMYYAWLFYDWKTPCKGGRRCKPIMSMKLWQYGRDYFPISLVKTAELDPTRNYIVGHHPHGVFCFGAFFNYATDATRFSDLYPGINRYLMTLHQMFKMPFFRDYFMCTSSISCNVESLKWLLTQNGKGNLGVIVPGGAVEALDAHPGTHRLNLKEKKGFIKKALQFGADLVPSYSFGEVDVFDQLANPEGSNLKRFQQWLTKLCGFSMPAPYARWFPFLAYRRPITTVVGKPIRVEQIPQPTQADIDNLHTVYVAALRQLFNNHKLNYGIDKDVKLDIF